MEVFEELKGFQLIHILVSPEPEPVTPGAYHPSLAGSLLGRRGLGLSEEEREEVRPSGRRGEAV